MFQIDADMVERSSTMTKRDIGKWAMLVCGCVQMLGRDEAAARVRYREITAPSFVRSQPKDGFFRGLYEKY